MRHQIAFLLFAPMLAITARADPIRYEQIPAGVAGYAHVNLDRLLSCKLVQQLAANQHVTMAEVGAELRKSFGGSYSGITVFSTGDDQFSHIALLLQLHDNAERQRLQSRVSQSKDAVVIAYQQQDVYYTAAGLPLIELPATTQAETIETPRTETTETPRKLNRPMFALGFDLGRRRGSPTAYWNPLGGPNYTAFVGQDLIVVTSDLKYMADALDVIQGRKPSLAAADAQGFRMDAQPGTIAVAGGLTASFRSDDGGPATRPIATATTPGGGFGFDLFGPFEGKVRLARFAIREDGESEHVEAAFNMVDSESAEQLKNLVQGVKALLILSQQKYVPVIAQLDVQAAGKSVSLRWSYPTEKIIELLELASGGPNQNSAPRTTSPSTQRTP